jgi:hypothetical protein
VHPYTTLKFLALQETPYIYIYDISRLRVKRFYVLRTHFIYVFCMNLRTNNCYFSAQRWLVFITETECAYQVRPTESLNTIQVNISLWYVCTVYTRSLPVKQCC